MNTVSDVLFTAYCARVLSGRKHGHYNLSSRHESLSQCSFNIGPPSTMLTNNKPTLDQYLVFAGLLSAHVGFYALLHWIIYNVTGFMPVWRNNTIYRPPSLASHNSTHKYLEYIIMRREHGLPLDMKGCIFHFTKWQIHPFISKRTMYPWKSATH